MNTYRARRLALFHRLVGQVSQPEPIRILDVGGTPTFWLNQIPPHCTLTLVNLDKYQPLQGETVIKGDALELDRLTGGENFDIVFSSSLLGQIPKERQALLARQLRRAGDRYFLQTPNQGFLFDWRTRLPAFHWLPKEVQARVIMRTSLGPLEKGQDWDDALDIAHRINDLSRHELFRLFPEGILVPERVLGLIKSFIIHHGFTP